MAITPVFCELNDDHIVVYQYDGKTRYDHGIKPKEHVLDDYVSSDDIKPLLTQ